MAKKVKKAAAPKKAPKAIKKKKAAVSTENIVDTATLTKSQAEYLEDRITKCIAAYPLFSRDEAKEWLIKNNHFTKVIR